jgi:catechol 2,3-dioxygenase
MNDTELLYNSIHPSARIGMVTLTVADLGQHQEFYQSVLGLNLLDQQPDSAILGTDQHRLLNLVEKPDHHRYPRTAGLYHFAVLFPNRPTFSQAVARLFELHIPNAPTNHIMTKATYLKDPEGNGIELYTESPEDGWMGMESGQFIARRSDGSLSSGREPLDLQALFALLPPGVDLQAPIPAETTIGHIHLHVPRLQQAVAFYHQAIGFDIMGLDPAIQMGFLSAGGYHHHIGLNTWQGKGVPLPPSDALGLRDFEVLLPDREALDQVRYRLERAEMDFRTDDGALEVPEPSGGKVILTTPS